jgi:hypothetical protein
VHRNATPGFAGGAAGAAGGSGVAWLVLAAGIRAAGAPTGSAAAAADLRAEAAERSDFETSGRPAVIDALSFALLPAGGADGLGGAAPAAVGCDDAGVLGGVAAADAGGPPAADWSAEVADGAGADGCAAGA